MSAASILVLLGLLSLSGLGICHKVADFHHCKPSAISTLLFFWASAVLWTYTILYKGVAEGASFFPPFTLSATAVAVACGACAGLGILTFQIGVRYGRISTSWLVINLSTLIPAILSLVVYREWEAGVSWRQLMGLGLMFASVLLLWRDKALEIAGQYAPAGAPLPSDAVAIKSFADQQEA